MLVPFLFSGEIQQRKQQRQKKLRMEKRREQKAVSNVALPDFSSRSASEYKFTGNSTYRVDREITSLYFDCILYL